MNIAKIAHEVNRAYVGVVEPKRVMKSWEECSKEQKASIEAGVMAIQANPDLTNEQMHDRWCEFKLLRDWKHGIAVDEKLKTHPCLVPYNLLPVYQKAKDAIFGAIVRQLLSETSTSSRD